VGMLLQQHPNTACCFFASEKRTRKGLSPEAGLDSGRDCLICGSVEPRGKAGGDAVAPLRALWGGVFHLVRRPNQNLLCPN